MRRWRVSIDVAFCLHVAALVIGSALVVASVLVAAFGLDGAAMLLVALGYAL